MHDPGVDGQKADPARSASKGLTRQGISYVVVGALQLGLDWLSFVLLSGLGVPVATANMVGRAVGAIAGFSLNGAVTFAKPGAGGSKIGAASLAKFLVSWLAFAIVSTLFVVFLKQQHGLHWAWLGKPVFDGALAVLGFLISKYWIFR